MGVKLLQWRKPVLQTKVLLLSTCIRVVQAMLINWRTFLTFVVFLGCMVLLVVGRLISTVKELVGLTSRYSSDVDISAVDCCLESLRIAVPVLLTPST